MLSYLFSPFSEGEASVSTGLFIQSLVNTLTWYLRVLGLKSSGSYMQTTISPSILSTGAQSSSVSSTMLWVALRSLPGNGWRCSLGLRRCWLPYTRQQVGGPFREGLVWVGLPGASRRFQALPGVSRHFPALPGASRRFQVTGALATSRLRGFEVLAEVLARYEGSKFLLGYGG